MGFDYLFSGPPTKVGAPTVPAIGFDKDNNVVYVSSMPTKTNPPGWVPIAGSELTAGAGITITDDVISSTQNAVTLQGRAISPNTPTSNQTLQWNGTAWVPATVPGASNYNVAYCTDYVWSATGQAGFGALTAGVPATITITNAPAGFNATNLNVPYWIYIHGTGTAEAVLVTGGTATAGGSGTVEFTPYYSHTTGYTISTATSGIQEAINANAGTNSGNPDYFNGYVRIVIPPMLEGGLSPVYPIYGQITLQGSFCRLEGYGASLDHLARGPMIQIGDLLSATHSNNNTIAGFAVSASVHQPNPEYVGSLITNTVRLNGVNTITTAAPHGFRVGDPVTILYTDNTSYWGDVPAIASVPTSETFTYVTSGAANISSQNTPGVVALSYFAFRDNGNGTHFEDISLDYINTYSDLNGVFDLWDDENCVIENFNNNGAGLNTNVNWVPSFISSYGANNLPNQAQQLAPVISLVNSNITCQFACGVSVFNNNGLYIDNTVIQASGPWQINTSCALGNFGGTAIRNLYSESNASINPVSPVRNPWPGLGIAGLIIGPSNVGTASIRGQGGLIGDEGSYPTVGSSGTTYTYYVVVNDTTAGTKSAPMPVMQAMSTGGSVTVSWPRVANGADTITYDVLRVAGSFQNTNAVGPYSGGCPGGSTAAMGSVVTGQAQQSGFIQTFTDNTTNSTSSYPTVPVGTYTGNIVFWPGQCTTMVIPVYSDIVVAAKGIGLYGNPTNVCDCTSAVAGSNAVAPAIASTFSTQWAANNSNPNHQALLLNDGVSTGGNSTPNTKGRLNFQTSGAASIVPGHLITLVDSNPLKTRASALNRPPNDIDDVWIGQDAQGNVAVNAAQLAFGAPAVISHYIANVGDNTSYKERLTSTLKTFTVPIVIPTASPTSAGTAGVTGQIAWDSGKIYVCTAGGAAGHATWAAATLSSV